MSGHTPGPWWKSDLRPEARQIAIRDSLGRRIGFTDRPGPCFDEPLPRFSREEAEANASMMAAGPELAEALEVLLAIYPCECGDRRDWHLAHCPCFDAVEALRKAGRLL